MARGKLWRVVMCVYGSQAQLECGHWVFAHHLVEGAEERGLCRSNGQIVWLRCRHCQISPTDHG